MGLGILYGLISLPSLIKKAIAVDHCDSENYRDKISPIIRYLMNKTMLKLDANRSFMLEGHNGSASFTNLSFLYMDITYLETNVINDWISFDYRNLSTSLFPCFHYISKEGAFTGSIEELNNIDNKISHIIHGNGTKYLSVVSLNNPQNKCIGAIAVT